MNIRAKSWLLALVMSIGLFLGMAQGALAQTRSLKASIPSYKDPPSARFDVTGTAALTAEQPGPDQELFIDITGKGEISGSDYRLEIVAEYSGNAAPEGETTITFSQILIGDTLYVRSTDPTGRTEPEWRARDVSDSPGGPEGTLLGPGFGLTGPNHKYETLFDSTEAGKEVINGAPTTKYEIAVDYEALAEMFDLNEESYVEMSVTMWVGDNDMYTHRLTQTQEAFDEDISIVFDITYDFKDFGAAIEITAPPEAEVEGRPGQEPTGMPAGMPRRGGMATGMPKAGQGGQNSEWTLALLGVACLAAGVMIRRVGVRRRT